MLLAVRIGPPRDFGRGLIERGHAEDRRHSHTRELGCAASFAGMFICKLEINASLLKIVL